MATINFSIDKSVKSNDWQRIATKKAQIAAQHAGIDWIDCEVIVNLPEEGRCFVKRPGDQGFTAYG